MAKESRIAPGFNCRNLGVPLRPLRAMLWSAFALIHATFSGGEPGNNLPDALGVKEKNNKYKSIIPAGPHAWPLVEAQLLVVALCSVQLWPYLCPAQGPSCVPSFRSREFSLKSPSSMPWKRSLYHFLLPFQWTSSPTERWKIYCPRTWFSWENLKEQYCSYTKSCPESWKI